MTGLRPSGRRWLALAALLAFAIAFQGSRGLWEPDEGRYAAVAVQMVEDGDWLTPRLNDRVPHFTKPPLAYWLLAASVAAGGVNEWALRAPNALAFAATILVALALGRWLVPQRPELAALIQGTSLLPFVAANVVTTDTLLALWEAVAVLGYVAAFRDAPRPSWGIPLMWSGFGLAMLTKGPPGLLPLPALAIHLAATSGPRALRRLVSGPGVALFAVLGLGWYAVAAATHPGLLDYWLGGEVLGRAAGAYRGESHLRGALATYGPVLVAGSLPWSVVALGAWARRPRERIVAAAGRPGLLLWMWLLLPAAAFALAPARSELYLLPLAVPVSLLLARALAPRWRWTRASLALVGLWTLGLVAVRWGGGWWPNEKRDGRAFAAAVARETAPPPELAVFVDSLPRRSLAVYLGCEVDSVDLLLDRSAKEGPRYAPLHGALGERLGEAGPSTVYFVPQASVQPFAAAVAAEDRHARRVGQVLDLTLFVVSD